MRVLILLLAALSHSPNTKVFGTYETKGGIGSIRSGFETYETTESYWRVLLLDNSFRVSRFPRRFQGASLECRFGVCEWQ
jgi:hypothetical protein